MRAGELLVFSTATLDKPAFSLPAGQHPAHVVTDLSGQRAFVSDSAANLVRVFDLQARTARHCQDRYFPWFTPEPGWQDAVCRQYAQWQRISNRYRKR